MRTRWLVSALFIAFSACRKHDQAESDGHHHADDHPDGHDHHARGHGHHEHMLRITRWGDHHELFAEHPPAVAGQTLELLLAVTVLDGFKPLESGEVTLELSGPAALSATAAKQSRPGSYELELTPKLPGKYRGRLVIGGPRAGVVDGIELEVFASPPKPGPNAEEHEAGEVEFLKEQQWGVPFATEFAVQGTVVAAVEVGGTVTTPPGGSAEVSAPIVGRLAMPAQGLPKPGDQAKKGQLLATVAPAPAAPEESARASLVVAEAEARAAAAASALERAERLIADQAISQRELEDARREAAVAEQAVKSAKRARALFSGASAGAGAGSWRLVAPISGTVVEVRATPGATVSPGELLFRIVDPGELWLRGRVPEQDAPRLRTDQDAAYRPAGVDDWLPITVGGERPNATLVSVGRVVDESSRTVDVIYRLKEPDPRLRVGGLVQLSLPTGEPFSGVVVPESAVVTADGRSFIYVQIDGEHFEERSVRLAAAAAGRVGVAHGLEPGQRIVTRGANLVRLASRQGGAAPHGHIH